MREEDVKNPEFVQGQIEAFLSFVELIAEQTETKLDGFIQARLEEITQAHSGQIEEPNARGRANIFARMLTQKKGNPNWVALRATCDVDAVFTTLCEVVQEDVEEIEKLPSRNRSHCTFKVESQTWTLQVSAWHQGRLGETIVSFEKKREENYIEIQTNFPSPDKENKKWKLSFEWDAKRLGCEFLLHMQGREEPRVLQGTMPPKYLYELRQVSQEVLGHMLDNL